MKRYEIQAKADGGYLREDDNGSLVKYAEIPQWIPVTERMPETGDYSVLCAFSNGSVEPIRMEHVEDWAQGLRDDYLKITHWMPLPSPPSTKEVQ